MEVKVPIKPTDLKSLGDLSVEELCDVLKPKLIDKEINTNVLEIICKEEISGDSFQIVSVDDLKKVLPLGKCISLIRIRDELLAEEEQFGGVIISTTDREPEPEEKTTGEVHYREMFRKFDSPVTSTSIYKQGACLHVSVTVPHNLMHPVHRFMHWERKKTKGVIAWVKEETVRFAAACMNDRTNGTIHFGVSASAAGSYKEGEIVGVFVDTETCRAGVTSMIHESFYPDQLEIALKCIREPQFIEVVNHDTAVAACYVIEVDIVPQTDIIQQEAFFLTGKAAGAHKDGELVLYRCDGGLPQAMNNVRYREYMKIKADLTQLRRTLENKLPQSQVQPNLREKLLNLFTGGEEAMLDNVYPMLFLSPLDSTIDDTFINENFAFIRDIDANVIFDFDAVSDTKGIFHYTEECQEQTLKALTTNNFDRKSTLNIDKKDRGDNLLEELRTSAIRPWIFCNGYQAMDEKPMNRLQWKQTRSEGFKEALRFYSDEIPNGRAMVIFFLFSKNYDIMLEAAEEVLLKFQGQWLMLAESEEVANNWKAELLRRQTIDKRTLTDRCVIGMPWHHVNQTIKQLAGPSKEASCELPTSTGAFCAMRDKTRNELYDLEILSRSECDSAPIVHEKDDLRKHRQEVEENFFRGGQVTWWNYWFQNHVLERNRHEYMMKCVRQMLESPSMIDDDDRVGIVHLYHQPGAGGTTSARQVMWDLRDKYRCCIIKNITNETCEQIAALRNFDEPNNPKPVLVLIDNQDEEKVEQIYAQLETKARIISRSCDTPFTVFCVLLVCTRCINIPSQIPSNSVVLKHELTEKEQSWFQSKYEILEINHRDHKGIDPRLLISFNILKENFSKDYIQRTAKQFVDAVTDGNERNLLQYLSLINTYDLEFQSVPTSAFDMLMTKELSSFRRVTNRQQPQMWESTISQCLSVLLNRTSRAGFGSQINGLRIINPIFAKEILKCLLQSEGTDVSVSETMIDFLSSPVFQLKSFSSSQLLRIVQDILRKRAMLESGRKAKFSPLIIDIIDKEDADRAVRLLLKGFEMTDNPMIAQVIARLYIHCENWLEAVKYAKIATRKKPNNSYLWDTYAQVYKSQLAKQLDHCHKENKKLNDTEAEQIIDIAFNAIDKFCKVQEVNEADRGPIENKAGYFGEMWTVHLLLKLCERFAAVQSEKQLHRFLVEQEFMPEAYQFIGEEKINRLKKLCISVGKTMRIIEEKQIQFKGNNRGIYGRGEYFKDKKHLEDLREHMDNYFGEDYNVVPQCLSPEDTNNFRRRRVHRLCGGSVQRILDLRWKKEDIDKLKTLISMMEANAVLRDHYSIDLVTHISAAIALSSIGITTMPYTDILAVSKILYKLVIKEERPYLEGFMYLVMFHWPTEKRKRFPLCPVGQLQEALQRWSSAFYSNHPRQKGDYHPFKRKESTYFFLGNAAETNELVTYAELVNTKGQPIKGDMIWQSPYAIQKLHRLQGTLINDGCSVQVQLETPGGNKCSLVIPTALPVAQRYLHQKRVYFVLGFRWSGPTAFDVTQDDKSSGNYATPLQTQRGVHKQGK